MIASQLFFWAQPSAALDIAAAGASTNGKIHAGIRAGIRMDTVAPGREAAGWARAPFTCGPLALGLLAVALRRQQLLPPAPA